MGKGALPVWGNEETMNLNPILYQNIITSRYFKTDLEQVTTFHAIVDEIYNNVTYLEPFMPNGGTKPSTAFCLLFKLFAMKVTENQMYSLLNHKDSPYISSLTLLP